MWAVTRGCGGTYKGGRRGPIIFKTIGADPSESEAQALKFEN